jgi:hypothetical protein
LYIRDVESRRNCHMCTETPLAILVSACDYSPVGHLSNDIEGGWERDARMTSARCLPCIPNFLSPTNGTQNLVTVTMTPSNMPSPALLVVGAASGASYPSSTCDDT